MLATAHLDFFCDLKQKIMAHTGHVMNLSNSIIGVSLLAMPFCFKQCGITLAICMLILSSIVSRFACHFLVKSSTMCRRRNFEFLAFYTFGPSGKLLVELGVIGFMMGTCVALFVVMGDLGPAIISKIFSINNNTTLRTSVLIGLGLFVVLPLGLLRNVESLAAISTVTIGFYLLFILKVFFESSPRLLNGDWWYHVNFWQPEGVLQCIPIFAMALSCQTQLFEIYDSLPSPSIDKINSVVRSALNLCTVVYASVGLLGYIAYCRGNFTGNILLSFSPSFSSEMFKLGFVLSIAVSFPLVIFPCRASLFSLIFRRVPIHHELSQSGSHIPDSRFKCLTIGIVSVSLVIGLLIPNIELVLGFVGSTIGIAICVIFPSLSFLSLNEKNTNERLIAKITLVTGLIIMITGTFGNLFAAVDNRRIEESLPSKYSKNLPQLIVPSVVDLSTENPRNLKKAIAIVNPVPPEKVLPLKVVDNLEQKTKTKENVRKEPPVPIAPDLIKKEVKPPSLPQQSRKQSVEGKKEKERITEKIIKEDKIKPQKMPQIELSKPAEIINKDAIEKEEREIMEVEKQIKTEEDKKQEELLKRLKEHQDEQKKLLQEQEKILKEIKIRENEKKSEKNQKQQKSNVEKEEIKTIKTEEFKANLNEIQNILNNLKDTKNSLEKEKTIVNNLNTSLNEEKEKVKNVKIENKLFSISPNLKNETEVKSSNVIIPLPLAKLGGQMETKNADGSDLVQAKQQVLVREILVEKKEEKNMERSKREAVAIPGGCLNSEKMNEKLQAKKKIEAELSKRTSVSQSLIKSSEVLSVDLTQETKEKLNAEEKSKLMREVLNQPIISKKRDLKSVTQIYS